MNQAQEFWTDRKVIDCRGALTAWKEVKQSNLIQAQPIFGPIELIVASDVNPTTLALKFIKQITVNAVPELHSDVGDKIMKYEHELVQLAMTSLQSLNRLQADKKTFKQMDYDDRLVNRRCLPELHKALKMNRKELVVKELMDASNQAEIWETEWTDCWSDASMQTDD